jgi:hypothetical protein
MRLNTRAAGTEKEALMWMDKLKVVGVGALVVFICYWFAKDAGVLPDWSKSGGKPSPMRARVDKAALIGELEEARDRLREMYDRSFASYDMIWETNNFGIRADIAFSSGGYMCNSPYRERFWQLRREHQRWKRLFSTYDQAVQKALVELPQGGIAVVESYADLPSEVNGFLDEVKFSVDTRNRQLWWFIQMLR